jgi:hypothetical protein
MKPLKNFVNNRWIFIDYHAEEKQTKLGWRVSGGELQYVSKSKVAADGQDTTKKLETYALAGENSWSDYRLSVQLQTKDSRAIGVLFRYTDEKNYYLFTMDPSKPLRALNKIKDGKAYTLKSNADPMILNRDYIVTVDCVGERLTVYLDGVEIISATDSDIDSGRIGLYCSRNNGARFKEVRVAAPAWLSYYTFGREKMLPAGSQICVFAGNEKSLYKLEQGVVPRFIAPFDEIGRIRLGPDDADLRLRAPDANSGHERRFLPDSQYTQDNSAKILRKADGTGFFLVSKELDDKNRKGNVRLKFTYLRKNIKDDPSAQILSQAGNEEPETVKIDIP